MSINIVNTKTAPALDTVHTDEEYLLDSVPSKLLSGLYTQRRTGKFCDVKIRMGDTCLWTHACVLSTVSAKLHNLFVTHPDKQSAKSKRCKPKVYVNWSLNNPLEITLSDLKDNNDDFEPCDCLDCVDKVVDFLYHGRIKILGDQNHISHIENLSKLFCIPELSNLCHQARMEVPRSVQPAVETVVNESPLKTATEADKRPEKNSGRSYSCLGCGSAHRNAASLLKHLRESFKDDHSLTCSLCLKYTAPDRNTFSTHLSLHDHDLPFFCLACESRFRTRTALSSHEPRHSTETPFLCGECGRGFKWKHALRSHALVHSEEKRHLCDTCGFSTAHISTFRTHKMVHAGVCFRCPQPNCKFVANRKQSLAHHIATHSKERHYQCEVCGQSFSMYKNLRRHATRHEPSPAGLICCPVPGCLYSNTRLDKIKAHTERHCAGKPVRTLRRPRVCRTTPVQVQQENIASTHDVVIHIEDVPQDADMTGGNENALCLEQIFVTTDNIQPITSEVIGENIFIVLPPDGSLLSIT